MILANWFEKKQPAGWTAVTLGPSGLCGVSVMAPQTASGKPQVIKYGVVPGAEINAEMLLTLAEMIAVPDFPWIYSLNHKEYQLLVIQEPSVQATEMEESVRWSIGTLIDFPITEANVAWMQIPTAKLVTNRAPHLYAMVARSDTINWYESLFQKAHLKLAAVDVRETAQRNIAARVEVPGEGIGLLSIGAQGVHFTITFNGELYLDRYIEEPMLAQAGIDEDAKERAIERIVLQLQRSVDFMSRNLQFIEVSRILVAPMPVQLALGDYLAEQIRLPVEVLDLATVFDFAKTPELTKEEAQAHYFFVLGAALRFAKRSP